MASENSSPTSFSAGRRWSIFFSVLISIVVMIALVGGLNYLGARYYTRINWSSQAGMRLSSQTVALLKSVTNNVKVIVYYDKSDKLYSSVSALLDEYHLTNPKISVQTVDYIKDATLAQQIKTTYKLGEGDDKDLVIFDCEGRRKTIMAAQLADYTYQALGRDTNAEINFQKHLEAFEGEKWFSAAILSVVNPKPLQACYLEGHGEHILDSATEDGYQKFSQVLEENNIQATVIKLLGTNLIPADCNLLIIAGPSSPIPHDELEKIRQFLAQGGRLFVLFNYKTRSSFTGLETILAEWNVNVGMNVLSDPKNKLTGGAISVSLFNHNHAVTAPLVGSALAMSNPRSITILSNSKGGPETPKVVELAYTGPDTRVGEYNPVPTGASEPVIAAVEKGSIKGVFPERGTTAILCVGDSLFLSNVGIDVAANRDFAGFAVNWLLDQTQLLQGVGPHTLTEYKLTMTAEQMTRIRWLFLAAMPGGILLLGGMVWVRRRR